MKLRKYYEELGVPGVLYDKSLELENQLTTVFKRIDEVSEYNHLKVLTALQKNRLSDMHFNWNTGYGYDDAGRDTVEKIYADVFGAEDAIVRPAIVNGTHALTLSLWGVLRPGDEMLSVSGKPYDTLHAVIGISEEDQRVTGDGSLKEFGITYNQCELASDGGFDYEKAVSLINSKTKMVYIQRSAGYSWRRSLTVAEIGKMVELVKAKKHDIVVMVDNCYGEFLDIQEPTEVGADIIAGSLIKNPGGGLALSGGYIAGKAEWIEKISYRMTSQKIGKECGLTFGQNRSVLHGLFLAPKIVSGAVKGAVFCSALYDSLGYEVCPKPQDYRSDIIQSVKLGSPEKVVAFCKGIQAAAPVDAYVTPVPWAMPGYDCDVIMAAGAFVQGSSIELSADAPIREPYIVYFQGGLTYEHSKFGAMKSLAAMIEAGLINL